MSEEKKKLVTLKNVKCVTDDIYNKLNDKGDSKGFQNLARNNRFVLATSEEVNSLIPQDDPKTITLYTGYGEAYMLGYYHTCYEYPKLKEYTRENKVLPWDTLDCKYVNRIVRLLSDGNVYTDLVKMPKLINTKNVRDMGSLYSGQGEITSVQPFEDLSSVSNMTWAFDQCSKLKDVPDFPRIKDGADFTAAFSYCESLEKAPAIPGKIGIAKHMFDMCNNLKEVPEYDLSQCTNMSSMFYGCQSLPEEFPWEIDLISIKDTYGIGSMFGWSSVKKVTLKNVHKALQDKNLSGVLGGGIEVTVTNYLSW